MGFFSWFDNRLARDKLQLAAKSIRGLSMLASADPPSFRLAAQNLAEYMNESWPRLGDAPIDYLTSIRKQFDRMSSDGLFRQAHMRLQLADGLRRMVPLKGEVAALIAHWTMLLSMSKGEPLRFQEEASVLAGVYEQAFAEMLDIADGAAKTASAVALPAE